MCFLTTTFPNAPARPPILFDQSLISLFNFYLFVTVHSVIRPVRIVDAVGYKVAGHPLTVTLMPSSLGGHFSHSSKDSEINLKPLFFI